MSPVVMRLKGSGRARFGAALVLVLGVAAVLAPIITPYDPAFQIDLAESQLLPPTLKHPFGTDFYSRDLLSRVLYGSRVSFTIALLAVAMSAVIGTAVGLIAGTVGRSADTMIMRIVDAGLAIPRVFLLLVVLALWGNVSVLGLVVIFGMTSWFGTSRLVRAEVLSLKRRDFVTAAHALGMSRGRLMVRHLLPNVAAPVVVSATLSVGNIILVEAGLAYLNVGVRAPSPSLGRIIYDGYAQLLAAPWISVFPGLVIVLTVIGFSLLGDALRDSLDPRTT